MKKKIILIKDAPPEKEKPSTSNSNPRFLKGNIRLYNIDAVKSSDTEKNPKNKLKKSEVNQSISQSMKAAAHGPSALRSYRQTTET